MEEQFILRVPTSIASSLREMINSPQQGNSSIYLSFSDEREGVCQIGKRVCAARIYDLPCVLESYKSLDHQNYYKCGDIGQVIALTKKDEKPESAEASEEVYKLPSGLTGPTKNIQKRIYRKRKKVDLSKLEREVVNYMRPGSANISDGVNIEIINADEYEEERTKPSTKLRLPLTVREQDKEQLEDGPEKEKRKKKKRKLKRHKKDREKHGKSSKRTSTRKKSSPSYQTSPAQYSPSTQSHPSSNAFPSATPAACSLSSPSQSATSPPTNNAPSPPQYASSPPQHASSPHQYASSPPQYASSPFQYVSSPPSAYASSPPPFFASSPPQFAGSPPPYASSPPAYSVSPPLYQATSPPPFASSPPPYQSSPPISSSQPTYESEARKQLNEEKLFVQGEISKLSLQENQMVERLKVVPNPVIRSRFETELATLRDKLQKKQERLEAINASLNQFH